MFYKVNHNENDSCHFRSVNIFCMTYFRWAKVKSLVIPKVTSGWKKEGCQTNESINGTT